MSVGLKANVDGTSGTVQVNGNDVVTVNSSGQVGVGTSNPKGKLQVNGGDIVTDAARGLLTNLYYEGGWKYVGNGYGAYIAPDTAGTGILTIAQAPNNTSGAGAAATPVERMRITSAGAIGINTDNPQSTLQVVGSIRAGAGPADATNAAIAMYNDGTGASIEAFQGNNSGIKRNIYLAAYGGNVGIGTISPGNKLTVAGNIEATSGGVLRASRNDTTSEGGQIEFGRASDNATAWTNDCIGTGTTAGLRWYNTAGTVSLFMDGGNGTLTSPPTYNNTAAGSTVVVTSAGLISRTSSSIKYKKDVESLDPALATNAINNLRPVWYRTKNPEGDDKATWSHIGLIAEEVHEVEPRLVRYRTAEVIDEQKPVLDEAGDPVLDEEGNPTFTPEQIIRELAVPEPEDVDYARLSVLLLAEVQSLRARVAALEAA